MDNLSSQHSCAGIAWGGGPVKGNEMGGYWGFIQLVKKGFTENDISQSKTCQKCSKLAQIEAGVKLHPMKALINQNLPFLGH